MSQINLKTAKADLKTSKTLKRRFAIREYFKIHFANKKKQKEAKLKISRALKTVDAKNDRLC